MAAWSIFTVILVVCWAAARWLAKPMVKGLFTKE